MGDGNGGYCGVDYWLGDLIKDICLDVEGDGNTQKRSGLFEHRIHDDVDMYHERIFADTAF